MTDLLFNQSTRTALERFIQKPSHALLIEAPGGAGKLTVARYVAASLLGVQPSQLDNQAYYRQFSPSGTSYSVTIDTIREVKDFLRLKTTGQASIRRVLVIENAHTMTIEAQNALLKVLEEPPADTVLLLSVATTLSLKPTILSRSQRLRVSVPTEVEAIGYFTNSGFNQANIRRAYLLSDGQVGLLHALLDQDTGHPMVASIEQAKQLLGASRFERMAAVDALSKQKETVPLLLQSFRRIAHAALQQSGTAGKTDVTKRWHNTLEAVHNAESLMTHNPNTKLLLTDLFLSL